MEKRILELKQRASEEEKLHAIEEARRTKEKDPNWKSLDNPEDSWKKRTMYDS